MGRVWWSALVLCLGLVLVTTNAGQNTGPGELIKTQIHDQINAIKDFISSHTQ